MHREVRKKLDKLECDGLLTPVTETTDYVSNMVIVQKPNGHIRIRTDHRCIWQTIKKADKFPKVNRSFLMDTNVHMPFIKEKGCNANEPSLWCGWMKATVYVCVIYR